MTKRQLAPYTKGVVTSADGTRIGYRQLGSGPGVVLLHGGVNSSQHLMRLGSALAGTCTVDIPDRRGRGLSGPIGADYGLSTEDEGLAALLKQTGARNVFGAGRRRSVRPAQRSQPAEHREGGGLRGASFHPARIQPCHTPP